MGLSKSSKLKFESLEGRRMLHGSDISTATPIEANTEVMGELQSDEHDWFVFSAEADVSYALQYSSAFVEVFDSDGEPMLLAGNRDSFGVNERSDIYLRASFTRNFSYTFEINSYEDDHANAFAGATSIELDAVVAGGINVFQDIDVFAFSAEAGREYLLQIAEGDGLSTISAEFVDENNEVLAVASGFENFLAVSVEQSQTIYVVLASHSGQDLFGPAYEILLQDASLLPEVGDDIDSAKRIQVGETILDRLETGTDLDWFVFSGREGVTYEIRSERGLPSVRQPSLRLYDGSGRRVSSIDALFTPVPLRFPSDQDFYIEVHGSPKNYGFSVEQVRFGGADQDSAVGLDVGDRVALRPDISLDEQWFAFTALAGTQYQVAMTVTELSSRSEAYQLITEDGEILQGDFVETPTDTRVFVRTFIDTVAPTNARGYRLEISEIVDAHGDQAEDGTLVSGPVELSLTPGDEDWFRFEPRVGAIYAFWALPDRFREPSYFANVSLWGADGEPIGEGPLVQRIGWTAPSSAPIFIRVGVTEDTDWVYSLKLFIEELADEDGAELGDATPLEQIGDVFGGTGEIQFVGDLDTFSFNVDGPTSFVVDVPDSKGELSLELRDNRGELVEPFRGSLSEKYYTIAESGDYYATVSSVVLVSNRSGPYRVRVRPINDDHGDLPAEATRLVEGVSVGAREDKVRESDWFFIDASAGKSYSVNVSSVWAVRAYTAGGTELISEGVDGLEGISFSTPEDERIYVEVVPAGEATVTVQSYTDDHGNRVIDPTKVNELGGLIGTLENEFDKDMFSFEAQADTAYYVSVSGSASLAIRSAQGDVVSEIQGVEQTLLKPGGRERSIYVEISGRTFTVPPAGYELNVVSVPASDDHGGASVSATPLSFGDWQAGVIDYPLDTDMFSFDAIPGKSYLIDTFGDVDIEVHDAAGELIEEGDSAVVLDFAAKKAAAFFVKLSANDFQREYSVSVASFDDDHGNSLANATSLGVGETQSGRLDVKVDRDFFSLDVEADRSYWISLDDSRGASLSLFDENGIGYFGDGGILWDATKSETLFAQVAHPYFANPASAVPVSYEISLQDFSSFDDHGSDPATATPVEVGVVVEGTVSGIGDVDWFAIAAEEGQSYIVSGMSEFGGGFYLSSWTVDASGEAVGTGEREFGELLFTAEEAGDIYISISRPWSGDYELQVREFSDDHGDTSANATFVDFGSVTNGEIFPRGDTDVFQFTAREGQEFRFEVALAGMLDSVLSIRDESSDLLVRDDNGVAGGSRIIWTAPRNGTFYAEVSGFSSNTGGYAFELELLTDNSSTDADRIGEICKAIKDDEFFVEFDYSPDGRIDQADLETFVTENLGTYVGDVDLDGAVAFSDFLVLSSNFGGVDAAWADGDFDCSGDVTFADFLILSSNFGNS